ncbi:hypothetical protein GLOTRDRAFT_69872 [Gloeophyllum trabeum ATCC 11539]|uniref:Uncharacterized protein n=1 Tax=Gloeophyllum trabeum (strain ATCC 11539 / FP-39264 / Madison 617) TaxID=670483 RepID=S7QG68_GLOTA|nr:uncharacterized protein GLOTRDRAFT_69872 [Gloeophyllum trabeum ATCC 11539]EPQ58881.1 hypothetical protein GLOTRDRAFT_69872 [Gloeophyllum trabeum ATCC 11539]
MSGESSKRSNLIDVTYQQLHSALYSPEEGFDSEQLRDLLKPRIDRFRNVADPFGKPSDASRKRIDSGMVTLDDGVKFRVENADKEVIFAISKKFNIDEVQAFILLRSFFYNEGVPPEAGTESVPFLDSVLNAITPFYFSERLFAARIVIPLIRAYGNPPDRAYIAASTLLPQILQDSSEFIKSLLRDYVNSTQSPLEPHIAADHRAAARWSKQNVRLQIVMLEIVFWLLLEYYTPCEGWLVVQVLEGAYETNMGSIQQNSAFLMDSQGSQLLEDSAAMWSLITVEIFELERIAEPGELEISSDPQNKKSYTASPESLKRIHEIITSRTDSQYVFAYMAWTYVLSRLADIAKSLKEIPNSYKDVLNHLFHSSRAYSKDGKPLHVLMLNACLSPEAGLFERMLSLLTTSPVFVTSVAWKVGSSLNEFNEIGFRSVLKGLLMAILETAPVEFMPDFDSFVEVWIALFGRSETEAVAGLCRQYWNSDRIKSASRAAVLDVARVQFPVRPCTVLRILRALTAFGYMDTDPLSNGNRIDEDLTPERDYCSREVFQYFRTLETYTQVIPMSATSGSHALYERRLERVGNSADVRVIYVNLRPIKLPGGTILPPLSVGRLLSPEDGEQLVLAWNHTHSGWKLVLEIMTTYVYERRLHPGLGTRHRDVSFDQHAPGQLETLRLHEIGMELDAGNDESLITDCLDLIRSAVQDNPPLAEELLDSLERGNAVVAHTMTEAQAPDLVQLTTLILEEALSRSGQHSKRPPRREVIISAMSVLAALLPLPRYSNRVWLFLRSTTSLFGSTGATGGLSNILAAERVTGHYTMTLALLNLVQQLFREASCSLLSVLPRNVRLQEVKEEVLQRVALFVHEKIWREYVGWKYARVGDKSEIGKRLAAFYIDVLEQSPPSLENAPFASLSRDLINLLLFEANISTVSPLISSITEGSPLLDQLYTARRYSDARRLILMMELDTRLARMVLNHKLQVPSGTGLSLLERVLCGSAAGGALSNNSQRYRNDPMDVLFALVKDRQVGRFVPYEAARLLFGLCASLASSQVSPPTIIGHLSDPEASVSSLVQIIQHPYDEPFLRVAVWNFISLAVDKEPALATLFVAGSFRILEGKMGKTDDSETKSTDLVMNKPRRRQRSALGAASDMLGQWRELWEHMPQLLHSILQFLDMVWLHGIEHRTVLKSLREDADFWEKLVSIVTEELGPVPDYRSETFVDYDEARHSNLHEAVSLHAYRTMAKALAVQVIARDIEMRTQLDEKSRTLNKPASYKAIEGIIKDDFQLSDFISEAAISSYEPGLYDEMTDVIRQHCPALDLEHLRVQDPEMEREFGDSFAFSTSLLQLRLHPFRSTGDSHSSSLADDLEHKLYSINLNQSITHAQTALSLSWQHLLREVAPFLGTNSPVRVTLLTLAASTSESVSDEKRSGEMMSAIHHGRLALILALLEAAWFSDNDKNDEIEQFIAVVKNIHDIMLNKPQSPMQSFMGLTKVPYHRVLLQIVYFCLKQARSLIRRPKTLNASQRLTISAMLEATQALDIDALRVVLDLARSRTEWDIDQDLQLLIAVFEQCTHPELSASSTFWLTRCQETSVIRASLELFSQMDIVGVSDLPALRTRRRALYTDRILQFHLALACVPAAAERLATDGLLIAYSNNRISEAVSRGQINVTISELPGERSPAHQAYCMMLALIASVFEALGRRSHHFDLEACAFVQVSGQQIARTLSWTIGDPLSMPLIEEMEQTVNLFYAIAESTPPGLQRDETVQKVLRAFTTSALLLLQQLNYALTHPNHLASVLEPVTSEERQQLERDSQGPSLQSTEHLDPRTRPFLTGVVHKLFRLTSALISTLISISNGETVLLGDQDDWPLDEAIIYPHTKVVLDEQASLGTLLELGNCTLDVLRVLSSHPPGQAIMPSSTSTLTKPLDVKDASDTARKNLEAVLFYAVTQLAMWCAQPEFEVGEMEVVEDASAAGDNSSLSHSQKDELRRSGRRRSTGGLGGNLKRGMMGEVIGELQVLIGKARGVLSKAEGVELVPLLDQFLVFRILAGVYDKS